MIIPKVSLGISFGEDRVDLVYLKQSFGKTILLDHCSLPHANGIDAKAFYHDVSYFLQKNRAHGLTPCVALARKEVLLTIIDLPMAVEENLRITLGYELDRHTPFPQKMAYFDYKIISRNTNDKTIKVLLVVIKKDLLDYYLKLLKGVGLQPASVEISSTALLKTFPPNTSHNGCITPALYIDKNSCEILLFGDKYLRYSRMFKTTNEITQTILKELERAKYSCNLNLSETKIGKLSVCGDAVQRNILLKTLNEKAGKEVAEVAEIRGIKITNCADPSFLRVAIGSGLGGLSKSAPPINFLPQKAKKSKISPQNRVIALILSFSFIILLWGSEMGMRVIKEREMLKEFDEKIEIYKKKIKSVEEVKKKVLLLEEKNNQIESFMKDKVIFLMILRELTRVLPKNTYLTMLTFQDKKIEFRGRSSSAVALISLIESSPMFEDAQFSATVTLNRSRLKRGIPNIAGSKGDATSERFKIKATLSTAK